MNDDRLDALLSRCAAPSFPAGLADRLVATATAAPQEAQAGQARRAAAPRRDRRGAWLRRPLIGGAVALGLAFSGAVAATLAGVPLPAKVEAVIAELPFVGRKQVAAPKAPVPVRAHARPAPAPVAAPPVEIVAPDDQARRARFERRMAARENVRERRALGLPTPAADRIQRRNQIRRQLVRRELARRLREATPAERIEMRQAFRARREERRARRARWREQRNEGLAGDAR
jgi:hypothetical protein